MSISPSGSEALRNAAAPLSVAVISPDRRHRIAATGTLAQCTDVEVRELSEYPAHPDDVQELLERNFDAILIDLDGNPGMALALVETLCVTRSTIVMVFSATADPELMLRGMRAGAREFFTLPFTEEAIAKSLAWVAANRPRAHIAKKPEGRLMVFFGSKGGVGVTTVACNFAVALAEESGKRTLLIDLNLNLGDAGINVGIHALHSTADALENSAHLDARMLAKLVTRHRSGLCVLAAPLELPRTKSTSVTIGRLLAVAQHQFDFVVVDAGKKVDLKQMHLFEESATAYLVTQVGIPELRNANRLIAQFSEEKSPTLEIVINRYQSRFLGLTDEHLNKALTRPARWKIPNDYKAVREMQSSGTAVVDQASPIAAVIRQMARDASGVEPATASQSARGFRLPWKTARKAAAAPAAHADSSRSRNSAA
jgi:pilus assembly protein CpaE